MKRKGFTLVELLVVIAIIALLMAILMPTLSRVRLMAQKLVCGTHQTGIIKACITYATDDIGNDFPIAPIKRPMWSPDGSIPDYAAVFNSGLPVAWEAFGYDPLFDDSGTPVEARPYLPVTVSSSLYLLVKYMNVSPEIFICKGDKNATVYEVDPTLNLSASDVWDFGPGTAGAGGSTGDHISYSYHMPYANMYFPAQNDPRRAGFRVMDYTGDSFPLLGDRNPFLDRNCPENSQADITADTDFNVDLPRGTNNRSNNFDDDERNLSFAHRKLDGHNITYKDGHTEFPDHAWVGLTEDYIWSHWPAPSQQGAEVIRPTFANGLRTIIAYKNAGQSEQAAPMHKYDAFLVMETTKDAP
ncbi:MAG: type II secretion system protein [Planctomycetota bacterium]|jgi:prepilin-type N-terminal cleavage/methylation domain-containing protein